MNQSSATSTTWGWRNSRVSSWCSNMSKWRSQMPLQYLVLMECSPFSLPFLKRCPEFGKCFKCISDIQIFQTSSYFLRGHVASNALGRLHNITIIICMSVLLSCIIMFIPLLKHTVPCGLIHKHLKIDIKCWKHLLITTTNWLQRHNGRASSGICIEFCYLGIAACAWAKAKS